MKDELERMFGAYNLAKSLELSLYSLVAHSKGGEILGFMVLHNVPSIPGHILPEDLHSMDVWLQSETVDNGYAPLSILWLEFFWIKSSTTMLEILSKALLCTALALSPETHFIFYAGPLSTTDLSGPLFNIVASSEELQLTLYLINRRCILLFTFSTVMIFSLSATNCL
ncbi:hypothetical protein CBR_g4086 [Chara braunii]|uniref:Cilia- and flagella-associated protein 61 N-terminal domain-containing protein n=1 Tax=Chara braunii TaxID=69332 RepID=A0A388KHE1_CHABU|nr:hypothetical protein CBR_g4086 [Chara braunii]|eukprot:GBG69393.1 hypothetical protein CBR_g4086 [Chara braunii]